VSQQPEDPLCAVDGLEAIDLQATTASADLQRRFDRKYVVALDRVPRLIQTLGDVRVLEVEGRRATDYTTVYFDTPDLRSYRDHVQRRRRRYKVRTRQYGPSFGTVLELKLKAKRGQTVKYRWPHPTVPAARLDAEAQRRVSQTLVAEYGFELPSRLAPSATTRFRRATLVDLSFGERITIDLGLSIETADRSVELGASHAVVEVKSRERQGRASSVLASLGLRPAGVSKYCVGVAAVYDSVPGNPWLPVLRKLDPVLVSP
jgi:hypothetical protein